MNRRLHVRSLRANRHVQEILACPQLTVLLKHFTPAASHINMPSFSAPLLASLLINAQPGSCSHSQAH